MTDEPKGFRISHKRGFSIDLCQIITLVAVILMAVGAIPFTALVVALIFVGMQSNLILRF